MVGELPTCLWLGFHSGAVGRGAAPAAKSTRNSRDSASVGPISRYISIGLLSAAAQNEHRANQYTKKESCFHFEVSSLSNSGPDARFSTYHLSVNLTKKQAVIPISQAVTSKTPGRHKPDQPGRRPAANGKTWISLTSPSVAR